MNQNTAPVFGLKELIAPFPVEDFISQHWLPNKPVVVHSSLDRFNDFPFISELISLKKFAPQYHGRVSMIHPDGSAIDVQSGAEALPYLQKGYTVYFRHIQNYFPHIKGILRNLASDLGMPPNQFTSEIFTSSGISGVPFHSDYDLNISLLLSGEKKEWTYAENKSIENQTGICMPAGRTQIEPAQMDYLTDVPLPSQMPADSVTEVLHPGDLIFMPRGWWHTTYSVGDCLCVNFVMKGPHWAHLLAVALESQLVTNPEWRAYPYGVAADNQEQVESAVQKLVLLLETFKQELTAESSIDTARRLVKTFIKG